MKNFLELFQISSNCFHARDLDRDYFLSYQDTIFLIDGVTDTFFINLKMLNYSKTTKKHINLFLKNSYFFKNILKIETKKELDDFIKKNKTNEKILEFKFER